MSDANNKLGQYKLLEKIAQGGMAEIYKAETRDARGTARLVVIKRILPHIASHAEYIEMLIDEAKIAVHFTHGNIAQVYDLGRAGDDYFIVMEYVDGKTLSHIYRALLEREQRLPLDILLYCLIELCHGLSYIHRKKGPNGQPLGVVHRDISPQNIILSYSGQVKIIDFGVAKADFIEGKTEDGVLKGKFAYMSPEQTKGGEIDHRSDIFSTGIILWELACGQRLFKRKIHKETVKAVQKAKFEWPSKIRPDLPKSLDAIVKRALAKAPRQRYDDAIEMAEDLEKILFDINPNFRPIDAAKFLYKLFGPEEDEAEFSHSDLTLSEVPRQKPQRKVLPQAEVTPMEPFKKPKAHDEPTAKSKKATNFGKRIPWPLPADTFGKYVLAAILIFVLGTFFTLYNHWTGQKSYLILQNHKQGMTLILNGKALPPNVDDEIPVLANTEYTLTVQANGYLSKTLNFNLSAGEHTTLDVKLEKMPETGDLSVVTLPQGASVFINGVLQPQKTPATFKNLQAGITLKLELKLNHYKTINKDLTLTAGNESKVFQPLEFEYVQLLVTSTPPEAHVFMDGKDVGLTPFFDDKIIPGKNHAITVSAEGYVPATKMLPPEATTQIHELHFVLVPR